MYVAVKNHSSDATRLRALIVTWSDGLGQYYERRYNYGVLLQPHQTVRLETPVLDGVPDERTVAASPVCEKRRSDDDE
jgi:hypothetical protein